MNLVYSGIKYSFLIAISFTCCLAVSCVKGNDEDLAPISYVKFFNTSENGTGGVDFLIDNNRLRTGSLATDSTSSYNQIYSGTHKIIAVPAGGASSDQLAEMNEEVSAGKYYSCFLAGNSSQSEIIMVEDGITARDTAGKARVRFINLSPGSGKVDIRIKDSINLFTAQEYKKASGFLSIDTSKHTLEVRPAGSTGSTVTSMDFHGRSLKSYTLYLRHTAGNSDRLFYQENKR